MCHLKGKIGMKNPGGYRKNIQSILVRRKLKRFPCFNSCISFNISVCSQLLHLHPPEFLGRGTKCSYCSIANVLCYIVFRMFLTYKVRRQTKFGMLVADHNLFIRCMTHKSGLLGYN